MPSRVTLSCQKDFPGNMLMSMEDRLIVGYVAEVFRVKQSAMKLPSPSEVAAGSYGILFTANELVFKCP